MSSVSAAPAIARGFAINLAFNLSATGLSSLATLLVVRALAPADWGVAAAVLGVGQLLGAAISFGSQTEHIRRYARAGADAGLRSAVRDSAARVSIALAMLLLGAALLLVAPPAGAALICAAGAFTSLGTTNYLISARRFFRAGGLLVLEKGLAFTAILALTLSDALGRESLPIAFGCAGLAVGILGLLLNVSAAGSRFRLVRWSDIAGHWRGTTYFGISSLGPSLLLLDATIVAAIAGATQAGYFSVGSRLVAPLSVASTSIVAALLPYLSSTVPNRAAPMKPRVVLPLLGGFIVLMTALLVLADWWVPVLLGSTYSDAVWPVRFQILNVIVVLFTRTLATILQAWGHERSVAGFILAQVLAALALLALGSALGGAFWASMAVLSTNLLLVVALSIKLAGVRSRRGEP